MPPNFQRSRLPPTQLCFFPPRLQIRMPSMASLPATASTSTTSRKSRCGRCWRGRSLRYSRCRPRCAHHHQHERGGRRRVRWDRGARPKRQRRLRDGRPTWRDRCPPRIRANAATLNTRNTTREHHHHHGRTHGREELTPHADLASLPMHTHAHPLILVAMPVAADGANAGPAQSLPARRERVEPRVSRSSDARCPSIACSCCRLALTGRNGPHPARDAPTPSSPPPLSSRCGGAGSVPRRGCTNARRFTSRA
ncbi:hypothetical protein DFH11DRAFT_637266 [Phellopilus nigrolimitatus]|nr:hypothetical protein DFH11DRAFT_637266 [Phellopilus nigrolimitatus]